MSEEPPGLQGKGWCPQSGAVQGGRGGVTGRLGEGTGGTKLQLSLIHISEPTRPY